MSGRMRILAIDGGGVRGIIPAMVLEELERLTERPTAHLFDLVSGTSGGGFIALLMTKPGKNGEPRYSASDVVQLYLNHAKDIFHRSRWHALLSLGGWIAPKYPGSSPHDTYERYLNQEQGPHRLSEALVEVLIPAYEIEKREACYFKRSLARTDPDWDFTMVDVARATSAAPTYFPAVRIHSPNGRLSLDLVDGGLVANNPATLALAEAIKTQEGQGPGPLVVSLGTGSYDAPFSYRKLKAWGLLHWAPHIADVLFDGTDHLVDTSTRIMVEGLNRSTGILPSYYRFDVSLNAHNDHTDDVGPENLEDLQKVTRTMLKAQRAALEALAKSL